MSPRPSRPGRRGHDARGVSLSTFVVVVFAALIMVAGLVIDGGQKVTATRRAEAIAATAARAGADAGAPGTISGTGLGASAVTVAQAYLNGTPGVVGSARLAGGRVVVTTEVTEPTIFLSLLGLTSVTGHGESVQEVRSGR